MSDPYGSSMPGGRNNAANRPQPYGEYDPSYPYGRQPESQPQPVAQPQFFGQPQPQPRPQPQPFAQPQPLAQPQPQQVSARGKKPLELPNWASMLIGFGIVFVLVVFFYWHANRDIEKYPFEVPPIPQASCAIADPRGELSEEMRLSLCEGLGNDPQDKDSVLVQIAIVRSQELTSFEAAENISWKWGLGEDKRPRIILYWDPRTHDWEILLGNNVDRELESEMSSYISRRMDSGERDKYTRSTDEAAKIFVEAVQRSLDR